MGASKSGEEEGDRSGWQTFHERRPPVVGPRTVTGDVRRARNAVLESVSRLLRAA